MMKVCAYPNCIRTAHFLMSWTNDNGKHFGLVCATCDRELGRTNLTKMGMPLNEAIMFERYLKETVDLMEYPDFPEWLTQHRREYIGPTELLGLSSGTWNALRRNGITSIEELAAASKEELLEIRTLGLGRVGEIQKRLEEFRSG